MARPDWTMAAAHTSTRTCLARRPAGERDQPVEHGRALRHVHRVVEASVGAALRCDDLAGQPEHEAGYLFGGLHVLAGRLRVIPHANPADRAARMICRSTESSRFRGGRSASAMPPMVVIEFIRWSVRAATSNSRHGVWLPR